MLFEMFSGRPPAEPTMTRPAPVQPLPVPNPMPQVRAHRDEKGVWWVRADDLAIALGAAGASTNRRLIDKLRRLR